jgi:hypothetical protein
MRVLLLGELEGRCAGAAGQVLRWNHQRRHKVRTVGAIGDSPLL